MSEGQVTRSHVKRSLEYMPGQQNPLMVLDRMMFRVRSHMSASLHGLGCSSPAENPSGVRG